MQYFPPFPQNPIVPSYYSYQKIDFNLNPLIGLIFPASFTPIPADETTSTFEMASLIQFINTGSGLDQSVYLPDATLGSTGFGSIFYNNTASIINIYSFTTSRLILTINPGDEWTIFLTDNTTQDGEWLSIQAGAGTSQANADALAGNGLLSRNTKLNVITNVQDVTNLPTDATFPDTDGFKMFNVTSLPSGNTTWNIPASPFAGFTFYIKNSSPNILTINATPSTIDGKGSVSLGLNDGAYILSDGAAWLTIGLNNSIQGSVEISSTGIRVLNGTAALPSYSFINYQNVGIFTQGSNDISFTSGGNLIASINATGINVSSGDYNIAGIPISYLGNFYP